MHEKKIMNYKGFTYPKPSLCLALQPLPALRDLRVKGRYYPERREVFFLLSKKEIMYND